MHRPSLFSRVFYHRERPLSTIIFGNFSIHTANSCITPFRRGHNRVIHFKGGAIMSSSNYNRSENNRSENNRSKNCDR